MPERSSAAGAGGARSSLSRRRFVAGVGATGLFAALGYGAFEGFVPEGDTLAVQLSNGYILVDPRKCCGCGSCAVACSLARHGVADASSAYIQVFRDPFRAFPDDLVVYPCRQCKDPNCVNVCPTGAMHADAATGVRTVDADLCIGCLRCVAACVQPIAAVHWVKDAVAKCDLCAGSRNWDPAEGTADAHACVAVCPMRAITFSKRIPDSDEAYTPDLRTAAWVDLGFEEVEEAR